MQDEVRLEVTNFPYSSHPSAYNSGRSSAPDRASACRAALRSSAAICSGSTPILFASMWSSPYPIAVRCTGWEVIYSDEAASCLPRPDVMGEVRCIRNSESKPVLSTGPYLLFDCCCCALGENQLAGRSEHLRSGCVGLELTRLRRS
jgi:hypothetical protein